MPSPRSAAGALARSALALACLALRPPPAASSPRDGAPPAGDRVTLDYRGLSDELWRPRAGATPSSPVFVYLHGVYGTPARGCAYLRRRLPDGAWIACPVAPAVSGATASWRGTGALYAARVARVLAAADRWGADVPSEGAPRVVVGFSQGSYAALSLLRARPGRYAAAVLIAGFVEASRAELESLGLRRVVLAASRNDLTAATLRRTAERLRREGFAARFLELGDAGHTYVAPGRDDAWREALAWAAGG